MSHGWISTVGRRRLHVGIGCAVYTAVLAALLLMTTALPAIAANCGTDFLSVTQAQAAAEYVRTQVRNAHYLPRSDLADPPLKQLSLLSKSITAPITSALLAHRLNIALASARDGHLRLELAPDVAAGCDALSITLGWTEDGLLVLPGSEVPAGARIVSIGNRSLDDLEALAIAAIPHENVYWAHSSFARQIVRADALAAFGIADPDGSVEIVYRTVAGDAARVRLRPSKAAMPTRAWVGYELYDADSTGLLWLQRCDPNDEFFSTLAAFIRAVKEHNLHKVVIDLRGNPGGDSSVALAVLRSLGLSVARGFSVDVRVSTELLHDMPMFAPSTVAAAFQAVGLPGPAPAAKRYMIPGSMVLGLLTQRLGDRPFELVTGRKLYVLTDGGTFSSAALFATLVRDNNLGTLVGEPTGNAITFNGSEIQRPIPGMPYVLHISTARLVRPEESAGPAPALLPDLRAPQTTAALRAGRDAAMELIRQR
jgi:hypothetical protein